MPGHDEIGHRHVLSQNVSKVGLFEIWAFNLKSWIFCFSKGNLSFLDINPKLMSFWCVMLLSLFPESPSPTHNMSTLRYRFSLCQQINYSTTTSRTWAALCGLYTVLLVLFCLVQHNDSNQPTGEKYIHNIAFMTSSRARVIRAAPRAKDCSSSVDCPPSFGCHALLTLFWHWNFFLARVRLCVLYLNQSSTKSTG